MPINKKILIAVDAPGPAGSLAPVIPLLQKSVEVKIITVGPTPAERLKNFPLAPVENEEAAREIMDAFKPDLFFATTSSLVYGPFIVHALSQHASRLGIPVICFQDYWGNHRHPVNSLSLKYWPIMLAQDEIGKRLLMEDHYRGKIIIAGNPALDVLNEIDVSEERLRARHQLGLKPEDFLVVYIGRGTSFSYHEDEITFAFLAGALRAMAKPPVLMARPHPRDESPDRYDILSEGLRRVPSSILSNVHSALCAADVVIGMDSTSHIHAIYLRIPTICLVLPHAGRARLAKMGLTDFPPDTVGASIGFYEPDKSALAKLFQKIRDDEDYRAVLRAVQEKHFPMPSHSAPAVAAAVLKQLKK